jgi:carbonic anhydrase/acetyltransferase-like protein (isoleucine patch superfamily)
VTIPSGKKVMPGKFVQNQGQVLAKTEDVAVGDRAFMHGVIEVNVEFAAGYAALQAENPSLVRGINVNPQTTFNDRGLPKFQGVPTRDPAFRNRIIGGVEIADSKAALSRKMGDAVSMRGDEGEPFRVGTVTSIGHTHTLHALEHTGMSLGANGRYGTHSLVHGGGASGVSTVTGTNFTLRGLSVFFRSTAGDNVTIGRLSLVDGATLASGSTVADCTVIVGATTSPVEWCPLPMPKP